MISKLIREKKLLEAKNLIKEKLCESAEVDSVDIKKWVAARLSEGVIGAEQDLYGDDQLSEASRFKIVRVRIRKGKIQRRKKVSTRDGFTFRGGQLIKMKPSERRNRRISQRRGKIKRRAKQARTKMKMKKSLRRLKAFGGGK